MTATDLRAVADALHEARTNRTPIPPPTTTWPSLDVEGGFEVGRINVERAVAGGDRVVGYKLGNIAKAMQDAFGLDQPDYGYLLGSIFAYEGTPLPLRQYIAPFVELEPAFILGRDLGGPNATVADVINAIDYAVPAIEIIDSRVQDWAIGLPDTLADNGSTGAVILGGTPRKLTQLNLRDTPGMLRFNGREVITGNTGNILGNPINGLTWLTKRLAAFDISFKAGEVILPGSCLQAVPMRETGRWSGTFEGWGTVEFDVS